VRLGNTVRRPIGPQSQFVQALLTLLEDNGFGHAPRFLGVDEQGREMLTFIEGEVHHGNVDWTLEQLTTIAQMIRKFHDASAGSELAGDHEVVCHNDLAPWNTVVENNVPTAFIDFDDAAPGSRIDDLAYFLWTFLGLGGDAAARTQAEKIKILCRAYGFTGGPTLVTAVLAQQKRVLAWRTLLTSSASDDELRAFSAVRAAKIRAEIDWVTTNRDTLETAF